MVTLKASIIGKVQAQSISYTGLVVRFQKEAPDGSWVDVQSNVRPLGTASDRYTIPANTGGKFRAGAALTDGTQSAPEIFSDPVMVAATTTPTSITLTPINL